MISNILNAYLPWAICLVIFVAMAALSIWGYFDDKRMSLEQRSQREAENGREFSNW